MTVFSREWAMPSADTFSIAPIHNFVWKYLSQASVSVDPFARNNRWCMHTNDLDPRTAAESHMDAREYLAGLAGSGVRADLVIFDPPYSPRQIAEVYAGIGKTPSKADTQSSVLYMEARNAIAHILADDAVILSFGWNSCGMGKGYALEEVMLVAHGGAHNDTICIAERRVQSRLFA